MVCAEATLKISKIKRGPNGQQVEFVNSISDSTASSTGNLSAKPVYEVFEENKGDIKYYFCVLKMPECTRDKLKKVNPKSAYMKKRCAENHVALLAIVKLRQKGYFNEYLFPSNDVLKGFNLSDFSLPSTSNISATSSVTNYNLNNQDIKLNSSQLSKTNVS